MINKVFGKWTVLKESRVDKRYLSYECQCECGSVRIVSGSSLRVGRSTRCLECHRTRSHGMSSTPTYNVWNNLFTRCNNPNNHLYRFYGARGIKVCDRWRKFENFFEDMGERPDKFELDRIDPNRGYEKDNCRWVSKQENRKTQRNRGIHIDIGTRFGKWTVLERDHEKPTTHIYYKCVCDCGKELSIIGSCLRLGETTQCRSCKNEAHIGWPLRMKK